MIKCLSKIKPQNNTFYSLASARVMAKSTFIFAFSQQFLASVRVFPVVTMSSSKIASIVPLHVSLKSLFFFV